MKSKRFRILFGNSPLIGCPSHIPWELVAPFENQALANHDQNLETLNARGGLGVNELYAVMNGLKWKDAPKTEQECVPWLLENLLEYFKEHLDGGRK